MTIFLGPTTDNYGTGSGIAAGELLFVPLASPVQGSWADKITIHAWGNTSGSVRLGLYVKNDAGSQYARLSSTPEISFPYPIADTKSGTLNTVTALAASRTYAVAILVVRPTGLYARGGATTGNGMPVYDAGSNVTDFPATITPSTTVSPPASVWVRVEGQYTAIGPTITAVSFPNGSTVTQPNFPSISATHTDPDVTQRGLPDRTLKTDIEIWQEGGSAPVTSWTETRYTDVTTIVHPWNGGTIAPGTYRARLRRYDQTMTVGPWSSFASFTVLAGASLVSRGTPSGRTDTVNPSFAVRYTNTAGLAADRAQVRLTSGTGAVLRTSAEMTVSYPAPSDQTIAWSQLVSAGLLGGGAWTDLAWGTPYGAQFRARATDGTWGEWSAVAYFQTDAPPSVPTHLAPQTGTWGTVRPLLRVTVADPDHDQSAVTVTARIKNSAGVVLRTRTMTRDTATGEFRYQTVADDIPDLPPGGTATYRWDASAYDGVVYSGGTTVVGSRAWSAEWTYEYRAGPVVTIINPLGPTIAEHTPLIAWNWVGGTATMWGFEVFGSDGTLLSDQQWTSGTGTGTRYERVAAGILRNGLTYSIVAKATVNGVTGRSAPVVLTVDYPDIQPPSGYLVEPYFYEGDPEPTAVQISWTASQEAGFQQYIVRARPAGTPSGGPQERIIALLSDVNQRVVIDATPPSGVPITYELVQIVAVGLDTLESLAAVQTLTVDLPGTVITHASDPTRRAVLRFASGGESRSLSHAGEETVVLPWGGTKPRTNSTFADYIEWTGEFRLVTVNNALVQPQTPDELLAALTDLRDSVVCIRDERGMREFMRFTRNGGIQADYRMNHGYEVQLRARSERWIEVPIGAVL